MIGGAWGADWPSGLTVPPLRSLRTVDALGVLTGAQIFSLQKEEFRAVSPQEGARVYSQVTVQRALLEVSWEPSPGPGPRREPRLRCHRLDFHSAHQDKVSELFQPRSSRPGG